MRTGFKPHAEPPGPHLVITGLMGVGKSTTAQAVAARRGLPTRDSDQDILALFGRTGAELVAEVGVDELHRIESAVLLGALADPTPTVISAAAWVVEDQACVEAMARRATVVVLSAPLEELSSRVITGDHRRTIDPAEWSALASRREPLFDAVADLRLETTSPTDQLAEAIDRFLDG